MKLEDWPENLPDVNFSRHKIIIVYTGDYVRYLVHNEVTQQEFFERVLESTLRIWGRDYLTAVVGFTEVSEEVYDMLRPTFEEQDRLVE